MKILLVEDDKILRLTTAKLLSRWSDDNDVDVAEDGETALEMMRDNKYDLVFLDSQLPGLHGHEVAIKVRQELLQKHSWLVGLSGHVQNEERKLFLDSGMNEAIQKPLSCDKFQNLLKKLNH